LHLETTGKSLRNSIGSTLRGTYETVLCKRF